MSIQMWEGRSGSHKRGHRAIERVGDGAKQLGFGLQDHPIGPNGVDARFDQTFLIAGEACARRSSAASTCSMPHRSGGSSCKAPSAGGLLPKRAPVLKAF